MSLLSCQNDIKDFTIKGVLFDYNKKPLSNVPIKFICWKYGDSPDDSYSENEERTIFTDTLGNYEVIFDKGAFVEIFVSLKGYENIHESKEIFSKKNTINLNLTIVKN